MPTTKVLDKASLPAAPTIPASNASYNNIIGRIQNAATHGPVAVEHVMHTVKGTNTYAKSCRRYAQKVIDALKVVEEAPAAAPDGEVAKAKPARKPRAKKVAAA